MLTRSEGKGLSQMWEHIGLLGDECGHCKRLKFVQPQTAFWFYGRRALDPEGICSLFIGDTLQKQPSTLRGLLSFSLRPPQLTHDTADKETTVPQQTVPKVSRI